MSNSDTLVMDTELSTFQKSARNFIFKSLAKLNHGQLTVVERFSQHADSSVHQFGSADSHLSATVEVLHPEFYIRMLRGGSIGAAEAYMDGWWESTNLTGVMQLMAQNLNSLDRMTRSKSKFKQMVYKAGHWLNRNTQVNAKKNIVAHYDLGNELYTRFLDNNMLYSAAIYQSADDTLESAQINKMERLCQQLKLEKSDSVIEIGTGWGGMAIYMAKQYGCHVTTTTISDEQYAYAQEKVSEAGLEDKITLLKKDYRDLEGSFDKLVSIEMIEAVGKEFLPSYIQKCNSLVKPGGLLAIQAITIADQRFDSYSKSVDFIQKYIFPGGFLPSITDLLSKATKYSDLVLHDLHDIGLDYAQTLRDWRYRFNLSEVELSKLGYDERFMRMWRYYLCYCEGGFLAKSISTVHLTFRKSL
jgi:cyclopropane-fatty-acyl-phospholipid synthase